MRFNLTKANLLKDSMVMAIFVMASPCLSFAKPSTRIMAQVVQQSGKTVVGTVVDENGEPMMGVTVMKGQKAVAVTDLDGKFTVNEIAANDVLTFTYVGYRDVKESVGTRGTINVKMQPNEESLNEVVVIGYGVQKKSNVTGAISSVKSSDLVNSVNVNAASALQGRASGVQVINNSGAPGAAPTIRVRGFSSNGSSDPLYIVDGLKVSDISYLDPNSIERMEVLKDAASAAIYGAEAGNGVILITTKNGTKGRTKISFDALFSFSSLAKKVDLTNASQYIDFYSEAYGEAWTSLLDTYYVPNTDTDWQSEAYETGHQRKYNLSLEGGNDQGNFYLGLGYSTNDGIITGHHDYYDRMNGQINASYHIKPWLEVQSANTIYYANSSTFDESNVMYGFMKDILTCSPLTPVYYDEATQPAGITAAIEAAEAEGLHVIRGDNGKVFGLDPTGSTNNVLRSIYLTDMKNRRFYLNGSTSFNIKPLKGLVFTSRLGYRLGNLSSNAYSPARWSLLTSTSDSQHLRMSSNQSSNYYYQWENFANYTLQTKQAGTFTVMAGMSYIHNNTVTTGAATNAIANEASNFHYMNYSTSGADDNVTGDVIKHRQIAYYGRLSWDYKDRYNFQTNFRADSYDSSYLDLDHNWGYFPSASFGWTFSNEPFMKNIVSDAGFAYGKLRVSYGVNGSISNLGNYMYATTLDGSPTMMAGMNIANYSYYLDGKLRQGVFPSTTLANPKLRWEKSKQFDVGLNLRFLRSRLTFDFDYYYKLTDGLLIQSVAPYITGTSHQYRNLGKVTNSGFEFEAEWRDQIGDFHYGIKGELATVRNRVKEYMGKGTRIEGRGLQGSSYVLTTFEEGYPLWYIRGYKIAGIDQETGNAIYEDLDNDNEITDEDRTNLGKAIPDCTYGITLTASYKGFDLNVYGAGAAGYQLVYALAPANLNTYSNLPLWRYEGRWTSAGQKATQPSALQQVNDPRYFASDAFVFDGDYFKIKQIQLGYTMPKKWMHSIGLEALRLYVSLDNFFTFTDYPGSDPETNASSNSSSAMALDYGAYPQAKSVSFGFNVTF
jgi:TonB-linked SusC/RagA family outer membrane protein